MSRRRIIGTIVAAAALTTIASPAYATDTPAPEFVTVAWVIDNPADIWNPSQHSPVHVTGASVDFAGVQALVGCGKFYQIDGYKAGPTTDALIAGGVLYGPSNPAEDLAYGAPGTEATGGTPWTYFASPDCSETVCTGDFTQATTTYNYQWDGTASVRTDVTAISATLTETDAITAGCYIPPVVIEPPVVVPPVITPDVPVFAELAHAGPVSSWMIWPATLALLFGAVALIVRNVETRKYQ